MNKIIACAFGVLSLFATVALAHAADTAASKEQRLKTEEAQHRLMWAAPKHPGFLRAPLGFRLSEQWRSGVIDSGLAPLSGSVYDLKNQYQNLIAGRHVSIFAGALRSDPSQGIIVILNRGIDPSLVSSPQTYRIGNHQGAVQIVAAQGALLRLRASSGALFTFPIIHALTPMRRY